MKKLTLTVLFLLILAGIAYAGDCWTCYMQIPPKLIDKLKIDIEIPADELAAESVIINSGRTDPDKYYEVVAIDPVAAALGWVKGDRFTGVDKPLTTDRTVKEISPTFPIKYRHFQGRVGGTLPNGNKAVHMIFSPEFIAAYKRLTKSDNLTDKAAQAIAKIDKAFIARTRSGVIALYPTLDGGTTDAEDNFTPYLEFHSWSCED